MNRCAIETLSEESVEPFISIKNTEEPSVLVVNPNSYPDLDWRANYMGFGRVNRRWIEAICAECALCKPKIEEDLEAKTGSGFDERYGFRIYRHELSQNHIKGPLYEIQRFTLGAKDRLPDSPRIKVSCVDDEKMRWKEIFAGTNTEIQAIRVNPNVQATPLHENQLLNEVLQFNPHWLISDKGLGFLDGKKLILRCKEEGIHTIMLTGEIQTDEARRVADVFQTKPVESAVLFQIMGISK